MLSRLELELSLKISRDITMTLKICHHVTENQGFTYKNGH